MSKGFLKSLVTYGENGSCLLEYSYKTSIKPVKPSKKPYKAKAFMNEALKKTKGPTMPLLEKNLGSAGSSPPTREVASLPC